MTIKLASWTILLILFTLGAYGAWLIIADAPAPDAFLLQDPGIMDRQFRARVENPGEKTPLPAALRPVQIAFVYPVDDADGMWRQSLAAFRHRLGVLETEHAVHEFPVAAGTSGALRSALAKACEIQPDYLAVVRQGAGDDEEIARTLTQPRTRVFVLGTSIPLPEWRTSPPLMYVGFDDRAGAKLLALEALSHLRSPKNASFAVLYDKRGSARNALRTEPFLDETSANTPVRLAAEYYTDGTREGARSRAERILDQYPDIDMIYCPSPQTALGAADAVGSRGLRQCVLINGWGASEEELAAIRRGDLAFTLVPMHSDLGIAMAETVRMSLLGQENLTPRSFGGTFSLLRRQTDPDTLQRLLKHALRTD